MMIMTNENKIWNDNPFDQWTGEELLCMKNQGICYGKGGGGSSSPPPQPAVTTQVQQSEFPTELQPFIEDIFGKAQAIQEQRTEEGFQSFPGPLQAGFDPAQTRAFAEIEQIPGATRGLFDEATTFAREATRSPTDPEEVATFMNPFLRNVTDIQKREAERVADVQRQQLDAKAAQSGAFGGSRAAILEAERRRNLATQLDDIEAKGLAASYQDAQNRMAAQRAREAAGATQMASLGAAIPAQQLKELGALSGVGAARQTQGQRGIDLARQEFEAEEAFPLQTLQEFQSILRGFPIAPTRSTSTQQFSAAQPLSTQLLGIGTQALGALGASGALKGAFGQEGGMVQRMPVKAYQGGGALQSLQERSRELNTSPVVGMMSGGLLFKEFKKLGRKGREGLDSLIPGGTDFLKKLPKQALQLFGLGLPPLLGSSSPAAAAAPTPAAPAPVPVSPELVKKLKEEEIRRRAQAGQQAAARGAGPVQVGSQVRQVRQPFKGGGGLRQMVKLPSNRVQFGKTAYKDVEEGFWARFFDPKRTHVNPRGDVPSIYQEKELDIVTVPTSPNRSVTINEGPALGPMIGATPAALADENVRLGESELDIAPAPRSLTQKKTDDDDKKKTDTKKKGTKVYMDPQQAGFMEIAEGERFVDKTPMINKQENVTLSNIGKLLGTYKDYKMAEQAQKEKINAANIKKAAAARAARTADAELALKQGQLRTELGKPATERIKALNSLLQAKSATLNDPATSQFLTKEQKAQLQREVAQLEAQLQPLLALPSPALEKISELVGISATKPLSKKAT